MKFAAFGEVMLRLGAPEHLLLAQSRQLDMSFTGTGVNLLSSLAHFGQETQMISTLPDNAIGQAAMGELRRLGIDTAGIRLAGSHIGSFFVELGFGNRPSVVTYQDRRHSAFGTAEPSQYAWTHLLKDVSVVHICGIALSLTQATHTAALTLAQVAHAAGKMVCFDFNYRVELNKTNSLAEMRSFYQQILPHCDLVFGSRRDLISLMGYPDAPDEALFKRFVADYSLRGFAGTKRLRVDGDNALQGFFCDAQALSWSPVQHLMILDRIGGGDAYAAGILYGLTQAWPLAETLRFAVANAAFAHAQIGDSVQATVAQVQDLAAHGDEVGRLLR